MKQLDQQKEKQRLMEQQMEALAKQQKEVEE